MINEILISPRYPASMVPGLLTIESPTRAANPDRGWTSPTMPSGIATAIPVGHQRALAGRQRDIGGTVEIDPRVAGMGPGGHG